jgi:hypothetical protein
MNPDGQHDRWTRGQSKLLLGYPRQDSYRHQAEKTCP